MAAIYLTEDDVRALVGMNTAVEVVEEAFRERADGHFINVPRQRAAIPGIVLHTMSAAAEYAGLVGWKVYATTRSGAHFHLGLYSRETGAPVAMIEADLLGRLRTGATTGVAARLLAHPDADEVGIIGAGTQAEAQLEAIVNVRPVRHAYVYCRSEERRRAFADRMTARLGIDVSPTPDPDQAVEDMPIVVTVTDSATPVFDGTSLTEGALVCAIGSNWLNRTELDLHTIRLADSFVCDDVDACRHEAGDFTEALAGGIFDWSQAVNLADVLVGRAVGRRRHESITIFKSVGLALEDIALGAKVYELAKKRGLGTELPF
jgi:ornithine cyclodeaminase/alanine dehydrogenase-like protein (mu-crystallin family)